MFEHAKNIVIKVTRDCNLRCKYCYVADKDLYKGERMPFSVFKQLINRIVEDKVLNGKTGDGNEFSIVFHGGEPTLLGYDTLNLFLAYAYDLFKANDLHVDIGIQTNSTLVDDKLISLFRDFGVHVGLSFDGQHSANRSRTSLNTKHYLALFSKLRKNRVEYGNITVVNPQNINSVEKNLRFFEKHQITTKFNYAEDVFGIGGCEVSGEDFFEKVAKPFLRRYIREAKEGCENFFDFDIDSIVKDFFSRKLLGQIQIRKNKNVRGICNTEFCGSGCYVLEVSPDGTVNACGRYDRDEHYSIVGRINDNDLLGLRKRIKFYDLLYLKHKEVLNKNCDLCPAAGICDFGCMAFHYVKYRRFGIREDLVCNYYKPLYSYLCSIEKPLLNAYLLRHIKNGVFYIPSAKEVTSSTISSIQRYLRLVGLHKNYLVAKDDNWKSNDGKCYQIKLTRKPKGRIRWLRHKPL